MKNLEFDADAFEDVRLVDRKRNVASFRLMERLGMRREGHLRQSKFMKGAWQDEYIYALLHDEWLSKKVLK